MIPEAFPADPGMPEFAVACDEPAMVELLRRHLPVRGGARIESCALEGIGHRRGQRGILQYRAGVSGTTAGSCRLTGVLYGERAKPGRARRLAATLAAAERDPAAWDAPFAPVALLPDIDMLVQVYPFDRGLPALRHLAQGPTPELAERLVRHAGAAQANVSWTSELVRYRPNRCAVLRYTLDAAGEERRFYVKLYADAGEAEAMQRLSALDGRTGDFAVPRPVFGLPELHVVVLTELPGMPLDRLLSTDAPIGRPMSAVATALAAFHEHADLPDDRFTVADEMADVERAAGLLCWALPDLAGRVDRTVGSIMRGLDEVDPRATHRDLKPDHVLVDGDRLGLVDMDACAAADPVLDPAALMARMYAAPFEQGISRRRADAAVRAFADAYFAAAPRAWRSRLEPHFAGALLEVAASLFRRQRPGWRAALPALVEEAERAVSGRAAPVAITAALETASCA